jgi:hypothetical protein
MSIIDAIGAVDGQIECCLFLRHAHAVGNIGPLAEHPPEPRG